MELADCALPLLAGVVKTADPAVAFKDCSAVFLVGAMPRKEGMERKDLLAANVGIFKVQGEAMDKYAKKDVKVLAITQPLNSQTQPMEQSQLMEPQNPSLRQLKTMLI